MFRKGKYLLYTKRKEKHNLNGIESATESRSEKDDPKTFKNTYKGAYNFASCKSYDLFDNFREY